MSDWVHSRSVGWMAVLVLGGTSSSRSRSTGSSRGSRPASTLVP